MRNMQITLTVTLKELDAINTLLQGLPSEAPTSSSEPELLIQDKEPVEAVIEAPAAGSIVKMPGFGRSIQQVNTFNTTETARIEKKAQEQEVKDKRAEIR